MSGSLEIVMSCAACQTQFLAYLYDLLDPTERQTLEAHLHGCPQCQVELARHRSATADIASAVKQAFPEVVFKTPRPTPRAARPERVPLAPRRPLLLQRWAVAAALVLATLSAAGVGAWCIAYYHGAMAEDTRARLAQAQQDLQTARAEYDARQATVRQDIQAIKDEIDKLTREYQATDKKVRTDKNKRVMFEIKGPRSVQAGAVNRFDVQVKPVQPQQAPLVVKDIVARVVNDKTKQVLCTRQLDDKHALVLPRDLPVRAGEPLSLELEANVDGVPAQVREHLALVMPEYVTYLTTDRPLYRPGEVVRFRSLTLERFSLQPAGEELNLRFQIVGPNNHEVFRRDVSTRLVGGSDGKQPVLGPDGQPVHGLGLGECVLPSDLPGGVYSLTVAERDDRFPAERRSFVVHRWQQPRFDKQAEFDRASYGPGDHVTVRGKVALINAAGAAMGGMPGAGGPGAVPMGGPPGVFMPAVANANIRVSAVASVNDLIVTNQEQPVEPTGAFSFEFKLPDKLTSESATLTLRFTDGGDTETLIRPIPIVLHDVNVDFYPEGGDLVAGVPNRVYFQAYTGTHRPADVRGRIMERVVQTKAGKPALAPEAHAVAHVQTLTDAQEPAINQGRGVFTFTPRADHRYELQLDVPVGVKRTYPLPIAQTQGVVLHTPDRVVTDELAVNVTSVGGPRELLIGAYCRGKLLDHVVLTAPAGQAQQVKLHPAVNVGGVYRLTVFEKRSDAGQEPRYQPVAERLLFRKQTAQLHVAIRPNRYDYAPRDSVYLDLEARNEQNKLTPAVALCAVVDASVFRLANDKSARSMPTHFLLTSEVRRPEDLENADALLGEHRQAPLALDLLLGTQGWRRFAEQDPAAFAKKGPDNTVRARRFLSFAQSVSKLGTQEQQARDQLDQHFVGQFVTLQKTLAEKERTETAATARHQLDVAQGRVNSIQGIVHEQEQRRSALWSLYLRAVGGAAVALLLFLAFFLVSSSLYRLAEGKSGWVFLGAGLFLLAGLFCISVLGTFALMGMPNDDVFGPAPGRVAFGTKMMPPGAPVMPQLAPQVPVEDAAPPRLAELPAEPAPAPALEGPGIAAPAPVEDMPFAPGGAVGFDQERRLRQLGRYEQILFMKLGREVALPLTRDPSVVREYAHLRKSNGNAVRKDFAETLCWQPALVLHGGQAKVQFDLADAVAHYRVLVVSHSLDGRLGSDTLDLAARLPYQVEPKVPVEISSSDQLAMPILLTNHSSERTDVSVHLLEHSNLAVVGPAPGSLALESGQTRRKLVRFHSTVSQGTASVRVEGRFAKGIDVVERSFNIVPDGFPAGGAVGGTLQGPVAALHDIVMPRQWLEGSLQLQVQAYPSVLNDLQQGLDALLREPHGCFEQSSSSTYPNVLILNYLQDHKQANPQLEKQARGLLDQGYHQLLGFECFAANDSKARCGYEWFGQTAPPHEALTAYGLLEFHDMARVYPVDPAMVQRTQRYLLDQRDGQGGFKRNARALDQFGRAPQALTNAYIVWALTESGAAKELDRELTTLAEQAKQSQDPYFLALVGLGQLNAGRTPAALGVLERLRSFQQPSGAIAGATTSITRSAGRDLTIETTALTALAWLRAGRPAEFHEPAQKAGRWLLTQRGGAGGFGSTQATVLALKALLEFNKANPGTLERGTLRVEIAQANGLLQGEAPLIPGATEPIVVQFQEKLADESNPAVKVLSRGKNEVTIRLDAGNSRLPYTLSWSYRTLKEEAAANAPVELATRLSQPRANEGQTIKLKAELHNRSGADQGMAVAVIGLPAGLALPEDFAQLKELARPRDNGTAPGVISAWELRGRELVLYWRELRKDATIALELDLISRLPGVYSGPASRAYLYYDAEHKHWVEPLRINIDAAP